MTLSGVCMRCRTFTPIQARGLLLLCAACCTATPTTPCADGTHDWRGGDGAGHWVCLVCATMLASEGVPSPGTLDASEY